MNKDYTEMLERVLRDAKDDLEELMMEREVIEKMKYRNNNEIQETQLYIKSLEGRIK